MLFKFPELSSGPYIKLSIIHNGEGMDEVEMEHFFDLNLERKEGGNKTDFGPYVAHSIIKSYGGKITL